MLFRSMSKGKILQIGSPRDIYDRPSERFVANFIGETNFLEGEIATVKNGIATVKLAAGASVAAGLPDGAPLKGRVTVVVRPEHASLAKASKKTGLTGRLENVVYFGTDTHYHVRLAKGGGEFIVRQQNSRLGSNDFKKGSAIGVMFEDGAAQVLKD